MILLLCLALLGSRTTASYYREYYDYDQNFIERDELMPKNYIKEVSCPVCKECPLCFEQCYRRKSDSKLVKRCRFDKYMNDKCGGEDCYRDEGEHCTENWTNDYYGIKCKPGLECRNGYCTVKRIDDLNDKLPYFNHVSDARRKKHYQIPEYANNRKIFRSVEYVPKKLFQILLNSYGHLP